MKVKGEGKKCKLAECAMCVGACPFGHVCARGKARGRGGEAAEYRLVPKRSVVWAKNRGSSKESPLVLLQCFLFSIVLKLFFREIASVRNKISSFALDKTQPPLFPPFCGVYIA